MAEPSTQLTPRQRGFRLVLGMAAVMWAVELVDLLGAEPDQLGIEPRDGDGLIGILASPFLHSGFDHLLSNTIPFLALGFVIAFQGAARVLAVTAVVMLVGGLGTWLVAPESTIHIGASGVVFGYAAYLIVRGFFNRSLLELALGFVVVAVLGGTLLFGLIPRAGVSWQGHLFGAIGGVVAAQLLATGRGRANA